MKGPLSTSRLREQRGSALIIVLVAIIIIGALGAAVLARSADSNKSSGSQRVDDIATSALDVGLSQSISRIQRVGSTDDHESETTGSALSLTAWQQVFQGAPGETETDEEGEWRMRVIARQPTSGTAQPGVGRDRCLDPRQRVLEVEAQHKGVQKKEDVCFSTVPRALRFALFSNVNEASGYSIDLGTNASAYFPPVEKNDGNDEFVGEKTRGGDVGTNGRVRVNGYVNRYEGNVGNPFYADLFTRTSVDYPTYANRYGGANWGNLYLSQGRSPEDLNIRGTNHQDSDFAAALTSNSIGFDSATRFSTKTNLPSMTKMRSTWLQRASQNLMPMPGSPHSGGLYRGPAAFEAAIDGGETFRGMVAVECSDALGRTLTISHAVRIVSGGLVTSGCEVTVTGNGSISVDRDVSDMYQNLPRPAGHAWAQTCRQIADSQGGELPVGTNSPCVWIQPAIAVLGGDAGNEFPNVGNLTLNLTTSATRIKADGVVFVGGDHHVVGTATTPHVGGVAQITGSVVVEGSYYFNTSRTARAVYRWHPLAQYLEVPFSEADMGTYAARTEEAPQRSGPPAVTFLTYPTGTVNTTSASITWQFGDGARPQIVRCYHRDSATTTWTEVETCNERSATLSDLSRNRTQYFAVQVCVWSTDARGRQISRCNFDDPNNAAAVGAQVSWYVTSAIPELQWVSRPDNPTTNNSAAFSWTASSATPITSRQCRIDGGSWGPCQTATSHSYTGLSYSTHTFEVRVTNEGGTATLSYTWTVNMPPAPTIAINAASRPANPSPHTELYTNFTWTETGSSIVSRKCRWANSAGATGEADCHTPTSHANGPWYTGMYNTFTVTITDAWGRTASASYTWYIRHNPPVIRWNATGHPTDFQHWVTQDETVTPMYQWLLVGGGPADTSSPSNCVIHDLYRNINGVQKQDNGERNCVVDGYWATFGPTSGGHRFGTLDRCDRNLAYLRVRNESGWSNSINVQQFWMCPRVAVSVGADVSAFWADFNFHWAVNFNSSHIGSIANDVSGWGQQPFVRTGGTAATAAQNGYTPVHLGSHSCFRYTFSATNADGTHSASGVADRCRGLTYTHTFTGNPTYLVNQEPWLSQGFSSNSAGWAIGTAGTGGGRLAYAGDWRLAVSGGVRADRSGLWTTTGFYSFGDDIIYNVINSAGGYGTTNSALFRTDGAHISSYPNYANSDYFVCARLPNHASWAGNALVIHAAGHAPYGGDHGGFYDNFGGTMNNIWTNTC